MVHPPAIQVLREIGIDLPSEIPEHAAGQGFVVFPDDGTAPCLLPYGDGALAYSCRHQALVETLRLLPPRTPGSSIGPACACRCPWGLFYSFWRTADTLRAYQPLIGKIL